MTCWMHTHFPNSSSWVNTIDKSKLVFTFRRALSLVVLMIHYRITQLLASVTQVRWRSRCENRPSINLPRVQTNSIARHCNDKYCFLFFTPCVVVGFLSTIYTIIRLHIKLFYLAKFRSCMTNKHQSKHNVIRHIVIYYHQPIAPHGGISIK